MPESSQWINVWRFPKTIDKVHESCYRSYHILEEVKHLLFINTPPEAILEAIRVMQYGESKP